MENNQNLSILYRFLCRVQNTEDTMKKIFQKTKKSTVKILFLNGLVLIML